MALQTGAGFDMTLRGMRRRLVSALRGDATSPLLRLAELVVSGVNTGSEYAALCVELGLVQRAAEVVSSGRTEGLSLASLVRLDLLRADVPSAIARGRELAADTSNSQRAAEASAVVDALLPISPPVCHDIITRFGLTHAAEPSILLHLGDAYGAARRAEALGALLGTDRWLLEANRAGTGTASLIGLNGYLSEFGLGAVARISGQQPLSVNNLRAPEPPPATDARAGRISVVMTCFQTADHLEASVRSVLASGRDELELIVVDDASTDNTWSILRALAAAEPRLRAYRMARNVGTYAAKNLGLSLATGEFAGFQDADDWSHPERFRRCLQALQAESRLVAVSSCYVRLGHDGAFRSARLWPLTRWTPNSLVFRRERVLARIGYLDEHRFGSDSEYAARLRVAFGEAAHRKLALPLIIAAHREQSLMNVVGAGVNTGGLSLPRIAFQERWTEALLQNVLRGAVTRREPVLGTSGLIAERTPAHG